MVGQGVKDEQQHAVGGRSEAGANVVRDILAVDKHVQAWGWEEVRRDNIVDRC